MGVERVYDLGELGFLLTVIFPATPREGADMITLTAYHGTSKKNAARILKEGFINDADSNETKAELARYPNDLGRGVYGYVDESFQSDVCYV